MWDALWEVTADFTDEYGWKFHEWPEEEQRELAEAVAEVFCSWGFGAAVFG